jgi:hypothetical protein
MDQGPTETCYAHAKAAAVATALSFAGTPLPWVPSPLKLSRIIRAIARAEQTPAGRTMPALVDNGATDADTFAADRYGLSPMGPLSTDGRYSDATPENVNIDPNLATAEEGVEHTIVGPYAIDPQGPSADDVIRAAIMSGFPVWTAGFADAAEMDATATSAPLGAPNLNDPDGGGHATFIDGWETASGAILYWKRGSWGPGYARSGRVLVTTAWRAAAWSLWPIQVTAASAGKVLHA